MKRPIETYGLVADFVLKYNLYIKMIAQYIYIFLCVHVYMCVCVYIYIYIMCIYYMIRIMITLL